MTKIISTVAACALLAACASMSDEPIRATAQLQPTKGNKTRRNKSTDKFIVGSRHKRK